MHNGTNGCTTVAQLADWRFYAVQVPGPVDLECQVQLQSVYVIPAHRFRRFCEALGLSAAFYGNITQIINA